MPLRIVEYDPTAPPKRAVRRPSEEPYPRETKRPRPSPTLDAPRAPLTAHEEADDEGDTDEAMDEPEAPGRDATAKRPLRRSGTGSSVINPQFARMSISSSTSPCRPNVGEVQKQFSALRLVA